MGWLAIFCCGPRAREEQEESERLIAPSRARGHSIASQDGYGATSMSMSAGAPAAVTARAAGMSDAQRERMHEISRAAGSHMRPIGPSARTSPVPRYASGGAVRPLRLASDSPAPSLSSGSSRTPSPSPPRPLSSPPGGVIGGEIHMRGRERRSPSPSEDDDDAVVRKTIFADEMGQSSRRSSGSSRRGSRRASRRSNRP